mmetsp:Transcript_77869/g.241340  ORF Transcript_77869/g.241340 Transcript_77869/m.241340 type:complete len:484 (+) Transcript_77869:227-1678(+)
MAWALAGLGIPDPPLFDAIAASSLPLMPAFDAQRLSNTLWSVATLAVAHPPLLQSLSASAIPKITVFQGQDLANTAWSIATLLFSDPPLLEAIAAASIRPSREFRPQNLSNTAWAFSTRRLPHTPLLTSISSAAIASMREFDVQGLANTSWAFAPLLFRHPPLWLELRGALAVATAAEAPRPEPGAAAAEVCFEAARFANHLCQLVWSFSFAAKLDAELAEQLREAMLAAGRRLDALDPLLLAAGHGGRRGTRSRLLEAAPGCVDNSVAGLGPEREAPRPGLPLRLRGISVVLKPPGWEVDAKGQLSGSGLYLSRFMQLAHGRGSPVLGLADFEYGFVHRLDVPSSGLVLAGTHFEGYALLQWQMHTYSIDREYSVLLRGLVPSSLRRVEAPVQDFLPGRSFVDEAGRPAETHLKPAFHTTCRRRPWASECFGLVCIAIHTGRRHQIRVHAQWEGHPTVTDEKYSHLDLLLSSRGLERELRGP